MAKGMYIGVNDKARKVKSAYVGVNGVARKAKLGYVGVNGVARQFLAGRDTLGELPVGETVYLNVNNVSREFIVVQQGLPSSDYDSSCDGTWLLMRNCYTWDTAWQSTSHDYYYEIDYEQSEIYYYLKNTFVNLFDSNIKKILKNAKIPYTYVPYGDSPQTGSIVRTGSDGIGAKAFLLSYTEVGFSGDSNANVEGAVLDYFKGGDVTSKRLASYLNSSSPIDWWLRSPHLHNTNTIWRVTLSGIRNYSVVSREHGVRPAVILPSTTKVNSSYKVIA